VTVCLLCVCVCRRCGCGYDLVVCAGGLGEAVCGALSEEKGVIVRRLAVTGIPRSGPGLVLMDIYGISARHIQDAVKSLLK